MVASTLLVVKLHSHVDFVVFLQVKLWEITIVTELGSHVLEVVIGKKAGVDVLVKVLSQLKNELILYHFQLDLPAV